MQVNMDLEESIEGIDNLNTIIVDNGSLIIDE